MRGRSWWGLVGLFGLVLVACKSREPPVDERVDEPARQTITRSNVAITPIPGAGEPGPVYLVINTLGVVKFDHSGATLVLGKSERNVQDLFIGPDGGIYLVDARSLRRLEGDTAVEVAEFGFDDVAPVDALALSPDRTIWVSGGRGIGQLAHAGEWVIREREALGLGLTAKLAVGFDGAVWIADAGKLLRRDDAGDGWSVVEHAAGRGSRLIDIAASPTGPVLATTGDRLIRLAANSEPEIIALTADDAGYTAELAIAPDGAAALARSNCDLIRVDPDPAAQPRSGSEPWRFHADSYACETLEAMTIDGRHRIWVASREGLSVVDPSGEVVEYPAGSFAMLAGRVSHMVALGRGPELVDSDPRKRSDTAIVGRFVLAGKPVAKAKVELCPTAELVADGSPCANATIRFAASTDARGKFRFDAVPIGDYSFAVEIAGQWRWTTPPSFAAQLQPGKVHDVGSLALSAL